MSETIFTKIINRHIAANIVYEDEHCLAFHDIAPKAPVHVLVIPKKPIQSLQTAQEEDKLLLGHLHVVITKLASQLNIDDAGYRVVTNIGVNGGQSVPHLHFHVLGGRPLSWPPG
jgi:histidine triad (HIT) family protein